MRSSNSYKKMSIKTPFKIFALVILLVSTSCTLTTPKNRASEKNKKLIAQANIPKEEKIPTINEVISNEIGFATLKKVVQSSEFETVFNGKGPYTIFAPLDVAFNKLPPGQLEKLLLPENNEQLAAMMNCHIIPGLINKQDIIKAIDEGRGSVKLKTLDGTRLIATVKRDRIYLIDNNGNAGRLMETDIQATNGMIHTLEALMLPKK